ncbi:hypothetical protein Rsub_10107 [Raphidocelis subcapitata]|uniref:Uncharacterized protein n=1 Tax=Raphidocelis subcapitata TaxID=307507 RepID=A0A2V0PB73_9CHLO|nr:hypothetical protein Rsub_10107 [Raphidocelis subcapitata]|eukprot:GBF97096.1 hypothetical protein Rsub_10107 [Raphidocelis subcapitata]
MPPSHPPRRAPAAAAAALALALCLLAAAAPRAAAAEGGSGGSAPLNNTVTQWTDLAQDAVRTYGIQNQLSNRVYALVALAQLRAIDDNPNVDPSAAAAIAGHAVLSTLFPWKQSDVYDNALKSQLAAAPKKPQAEAQRKIAAAAGALVKTAIGGASAEFPSDFKYAEKGTAGLFKYQPTPGQKYPRLSEVARAYKPPSPRGVDYDETYRLGGKDSKERGQEQADVALFWADGANTSAISGHWLNITTRVLPKDTSVRDTALTLARAFVAAWDASIACWKVKYGVLHWRPVTAFNSGWPAADGIKAFSPDANWTQLLSRTPPHPEYPSGHQCTVGAVLEALVRTLGTDKVDFSIGSEGTPWLGERSYDSLAAAAAEVGESRLWGGVHFRSANEDGVKLGRQVAGEVFDTIGSKKGGSRH